MKTIVSRSPPMVGRTLPEVWTRDAPNDQVTVIVAVIPEWIVQW